MPRLIADSLYSADGLQLRRVACDGVDDVRPRDEGTDEGRIILILRGRFTFQDAAGRAVASPAAGLFLRDGHTYRVRHIDGGDLCVALQGDVCRALVDDGPVLRRLPVSSYLRVRDLAVRLAAGEAIARLAVEEELASALSPVGSRDRMQARDAAIAEAIAYAIERDVDARIGLRTLAHQAGVSMFHACRVFKRVMGVSIHRYHQEIRLRHALAFLLETERPVAQIAMDCGFANQGHLTNLFRRRFRTTPARLRTIRTSAASALLHG